MQAKVALEKAGASGTPSLMTNMLKQSGLERQKLAPLKKAPMKKAPLGTGPRNSMPPAAGFKKTANQAHQARVNFLASIQGGWENLLPAPPALQAMAQPQTGHATRQQSAIQGAQAAAEPAQGTQPTQARKRKRPAADSPSEKNDSAIHHKGVLSVISVST